MPKYTRVHRLLKILTLIQSRSECTPAGLARSCDVVERTIFRDLNELTHIGIPIKFNAETSGYEITGAFFLPPVQLTPVEALSLLVLCEHVAKAEQIAFLKPAWRALEKVMTVLPPSVRDEVAALRETMIVQTARSMDAESADDVYETMQQAIARRCSVVCRYESAGTDGGGDEFDFEPYALFFSVRAWYVIGHHTERQAMRSLKLNRFTKASITHRSFEIPAEYSIESYLGNAWRMMRGDVEYDVEIVFDPAFAETISDTRWHPTQQVEFADDGSATFRCRVAGLDEIVWWVLSMGPHCTVVEPAELRDRVRAYAEQTARLYDTC
ncbi:MAG: WYL domain-containing transcriptional regulator [Phycisphaerales bacterium]|nr:WYL domain-containing transcriptional regulator [Phycisphaerales bacterium]